MTALLVTLSDFEAGSHVPIASLGVFMQLFIFLPEQGVAPGAARCYSLTADGSSTVAKIAADLRPSADGSAVRTSWWPAVAKLRASSVPVA